MTTPLTPPPFWTPFSPALRTELRNILSPDALGSAIEDPTNETTVSQVSTLANNLLQDKKYDIAEELFTYHLATKMFSSKGQETMQTMKLKYNIAYAQLCQDEFAKSEVGWRELLDLHMKYASVNGLSSLGAKSNLGVSLNKQGKFEEAEGVLRGLVEEMKVQFSDGSDPRLLGGMRHLSEALAGQGKFEEAVELNRVGLGKAERCGEEHREDEVKAIGEMKELIEERMEDQVRNA